MPDVDPGPRAPKRQWPGALNVRRPADPDDPRDVLPLETPARTRRPWLAAVLAAGLLAVLAVGVTGLPDSTAPLPDVARQAMTIAEPVWGSTEAVSEVVYGSRGFDTFGETFLLLAAVVSLGLLARTREPRAEYLGEDVAAAREQAQADPRVGADTGERQARQAEDAEECADDDSDSTSHDDPDDDSGDRPDDDPVARRGDPQDADFRPLGEHEPEPSQEMTVVVRVAARIGAATLGMVALYVVAWGYTPGGGFPGGVAIAGVVVLLYAAYGYRWLRLAVRPSVLEPVELAGALVIVLTETLGLVLKGSFSQNWLPLAPLGTIRAGGVLQAFSGAEFVEVGTGLLIAIFSLLGLRHDWAPDEESSQDESPPDEAGSVRGAQQAQEQTQEQTA